MSFIDRYQRMSVDDLRGEVISLLKKAYADGRITVESLERRLGEATGAVDKEALMALISDIPASENENNASDSSEESERPWMINSRVPRENQSFFAVLGSSSRNSRWQPARSITCLSLLGSVKLDFREAEFPRSGITINAGCIMGSLEILIPPGINADLSGLPLLGSMDNKADAGDEGAPLISVRGFAVMGSVEIKRKELKQKRQSNAAKRRKAKNRR